ncbi:IS200/IS605 family transposase [Brucellaceae bacterium VT-16-1752]|nr:IS200/IS605 family transposase [Brucellaceae bacterium VT-16-1752]
MVSNLRLQTNIASARSPVVHTVFYHRYHIVWITKYHYKLLKGSLGLRIREIIRQVCKELDVKIIKCVISGDHVHMMISIPPHLAVSDVVRRMKGRSSNKVQQEFPECWFPRRTEPVGVRIKTWTGFTSQCQDCFDIRLGFERQVIS